MTREVATMVRVCAAAALWTAAVFLAITASFVPALTPAEILTIGAAVVMTCWAVVEYASQRLLYDVTNLTDSAAERTASKLAAVLREDRENVSSIR